LEPATPDWAYLVSTLWESVVASASISELAARLATFHLDRMPSFAAFFWGEDGMRSLVRGAVSVVDLDDEAVLVNGDGIQTWSEVGLGEVTQVRVDTPHSVAADDLALPLVVGAVRASSVTLDATDAARVVSPQALLSDADDEPERYDESEGEEPEAFDQPDREPVSAPEPESVATPVAVEDEDPDNDAPLDGQATEAMPPPFANGLFDNDDLENGDTQLMAPLPAPFASAVPPTNADPDSMIMAVICPYGHLSSEAATGCRICGSAIPPQGPRMVPRPVLAVLRGSDGTTTAVDRAVLVGRAPSDERSNARAPRLMTVPSPGQDISRSHAEVAPDGWQIQVTDLHSTNGTVIVGPGGRERIELPPGQPVHVELGSVMELGDGVSVLIDFPQ
jgi:hypothetical protein